MKLDQSYWEKRYEDKSTSWNIGFPSTPIKEYIDQLTDTNIKILIPGAGNAFEAEYLHNKGYDVTVVDIAPTPLKNLKSRTPDFPQENLLNINFFDLTGKFDLIIEQTFFCAIDPKLRNAYVNKVHELLSANGQLVGLLFDRKFEKEGPPFDGSIEEYRLLFQSKFVIKTMEPCYNSIETRAGSELFFVFQK